MSTDASDHIEIRASDADREQIARQVLAAGGDGRLSMTEMDDRLQRVYAAKFRRELADLIVDLSFGAPGFGSVEDGKPAAQADPLAPAIGAVRGVGPGLIAHIAIATFISLALVLGWSRSGSPFFWPIFPMMWLGVSIIVHVAIRRRRQRGAGYRNGWWPGNFGDEYERIPDRSYRRGCGRSW